MRTGSAGDSRSERERSLEKVLGQEGEAGRGGRRGSGGRTLILTGLPPSATGGFGKTE